MLQTVWRRGWDSNPRYACTYSGFRDRPVQPLWHLSEGADSTTGNTAPQPRYHLPIEKCDVRAENDPAQIVWNDMAEVLAVRNVA